MTAQRAGEGENLPGQQRRMDLGVAGRTNLIQVTRAGDATVIKAKGISRLPAVSVKE
jgi:hypothetical protein